MILADFPTVWDAWAFSVTALGVDPFFDSPAWARQWTNKPPEDAGKERQPVPRQLQLW